MILRAIDLEKSYIDSDQRIEVLKGASLDVDSGDLICITGKSGCGKSTMLHIMGLLDSPDRGEMIMDGKLIKAESAEAPTIRNRDLGFVFQFHYLIEDLNAWENVALPQLIQGISEKEAGKRARELLERLGLADRMNRYPNQLSGGEQQRVSLARALANKPKLVLADEPTGNLDPAHSYEVWDMILSLNKEMGQAFVVVTHDIEAARKVKRIYELTGGKLILQED
jgi:lipoprotein-releasing system ATP-binding protein